MTKSINMIGPQFDRGATDPAPTGPPQSRAEWDALRSASYAELKERGLRPWDDTNPVLMLFPFEWFDFVPDGFLITTVMDTVLAFDRVEMLARSDKRLGLCPFGIVVPR